MLIEALHNGALLCFTAIGLFLVSRSRHHRTGLAGAVVIGLNYGLVAFLVVVGPLETGHGATVDTRAGPVIAAGIFGGPVAAVIAAGMGAAARWSLGGTFAFSGAFAFLPYALIGALLWRRYFTDQLGDGVGWARLLLATGLSIVAAACMYFLIEPPALANRWLVGILPFITAANTVSILLCGLIGRAVLAAARQRRDLEEALETLELAKCSAGIGIWSVDHATWKVTWDEANKALHGLDPGHGTLRYEDWAQTLHPEDLPRVKSEFKDALKGIKPFDTTYRVVLSDGRVRHLKGNATVLRDAAKKPLRTVGLNFDITNLVEKETALEESRSIAAQAQKMEMIGQLTGGVAHDFNNLLAVILGNLELIEETGTPEGIRDYVTAAKGATHRGADLTKSLLGFARKSPLEPTEIDVNQMIRETRSWSSRVIRKNIRVEIVLADDLRTVEADAALTQNVLLNLILNARDAMPNGGRLKIETANLDVDEDDTDLRNEEITPGRYVMVVVSDTGDGIAPENLERIFEPFFTTKPVGAGSGLGLSMVEGFMKQSGGTVRVESEPGAGTTFTLYFRAKSGSDAAPVHDEPEAREPERSGARILVVEDEAAVLDVIKATLEQAGYSIVKAKSGDEALRIWEADPHFDLVLTDIVMPGDLQGTHLARALRERRPDLRVVFMSGYASDATAQGERLGPDDVRMMKPIRRADLLAQVEKALCAGG